MWEKFGRSLVRVTSPSEKEINRLLDEHDGDF